MPSETPRTSHSAASCWPVSRWAVSRRAVSIGDGGRPLGRRAQRGWGTAAAAVVLLGLAGCDAKGGDRRAVVIQGDAVSRGLVEELASLQSVNGQDQATMLQDAGYSAEGAREFLGQLITLKIAANELNAIGFEEPETLMDQVERAYPAEAFEPEVSEEFRSLVVEFLANGEWVQNAGEPPAGAAEKLLERHPELAQQVCYDALVALEFEADNARRQLEHDDLSQVEGARSDECLPVAQLVVQPEAIRNVLAAGRVGETVGPIEIGDGVNTTTVWLRPRGSEPLPAELRLEYANSLLAQPIGLGALIATLPGQVEVSSEFADVLIPSPDLVMLTPAGVGDPVGFAAEALAQRSAAQNPAAQDPAAQDPAAQAAAQAAAAAAG